MSLTPPIVKLDNVTFAYLYSEIPAIQNINLEINKGELVAVVGALGSGKTTLLRTFNGVAPHHFPGKLSGNVFVEGLNTKEHEVAELSKIVGLVLDEPSTQIFNLTVEDDVAFGPMNLGMPYGEVERRASYAIETLRLYDLEKKHPRELSGGQQQRVALAGVLAMRPKLIALDEPISMLDPIGKYEVLNAISDLGKKHGIACVIAESGSDLEEVISLATRVIVMEKGRILLDGNPKKAMEETNLEELGVGLPQVVELFIKLSRKLNVEKIPMPLSVEEAIGYIKDYIKNGIISVKGKEEYALSVSKRVPHEVGYKPKPVLVAEDVFYTYPDGTIALKGINAEIYENEMLGLIGQNGSGKTTFALNCVGALKPTNRDAKITIDGLNVLKAKKTDLIKRINYVFQNPDNQLFSANIIDEVSFALKMFDVAPDEVKDRVNETLSMLELDKYKDINIVNLTKDLKTLVALASILVIKPKVLIIDEPTSGLDRKRSTKLMNTLKSFTKKGHSIVIITHDMRLVYEFCDRVIAMSDGKKLLEGTPAQVFSQVETLRKTFIRPPQITQLAYELSKDYEVPREVCLVDEFLELITPLKGE
ncbi:MAG: energy-coupling factor transporter ATPase [Candidatus Bathyarchaeia archaeon]